MFSFFPKAGSRLGRRAADAAVACVPARADGHGLYVGGSFPGIGGQSVRRLAPHNLAPGLVDPPFPPPPPNAYVRPLALAGSRLYIGGAFTGLRSGATTTS